MSAEPTSNGNPKTPGKGISWLVLLTIVGMLLNACGSIESPVPSDGTQQPTATIPLPTSTPSLQTEVTFRVHLPENTPSEDAVFLHILDEVTGLGLNVAAREMQAEQKGLFSVKAVFPLGAVVKYRYARQSQNGTLLEYSSDGRQTRYRLYYVQGPGVVEDTVSRWTDTDFIGPSGRIIGQVSDAQNGLPVPNLLVTAGGTHTQTASDGSYLLEGLPPGTHNLVFYAMDGAYHTYQQGALVAEESSTPASLALEPAETISVTFQVRLPPNSIPGVPVRVAGNLYQLGNTFADLDGGFNTLAARMPALVATEDGAYEARMRLPAGADLRYLYTLGDGFWNTEYDPQGRPALRRIVLPDEDILIQDEILTWSTTETTPVTFDITVPANTPASDLISIQFNPLFGWTQPIPMWRLSETRWAYILQAPSGIMDTLQYRVCRDDLCGIADDTATAGPGAAGRPVSDALEEGLVQAEVESWAWWGAESSAPESTFSAEVPGRGVDFLAGIEFMPAYHPAWSQRNDRILDDVQVSGGNWLLLSPTWTNTRINPPLLEPLAGVDASWLDLQTNLESAQGRGLSTALFPTPRLQEPNDEWWGEAQADFSWWIVWFEEYSNFILHHADLAARSGAQALILGGEWVSPALPNGDKPDGSPSGVPNDAETRWRELIAKIRLRFEGELFWALPYAQVSGTIPPFLDTVDRIYVLYEAPLAATPQDDYTSLLAEAGRYMDAGLPELAQNTQKPLILGVSYASVDGGATACIFVEETACVPQADFSIPGLDIPVAELDLDEQAMAYQAVLSAAATRDWISGVVSRGYYPPAALQDESYSIHGKPAQGVVQYWFPRLLAAPVGE